MTTPVLDAPATEVVPRVSLRRLSPALAAWATGAAVYLLTTAYHYRALGIAVRPAKLFFEDWLVWDTGHYLDIATGGYTPFDQYAFFPLYPLILRGTDYLPGGVRVAGPIVTMLIALAALIVVQLLTEREFDRETARRTVFYLIAFPTAFFLFAPYNEGLFVLLAATALYAARKQAWWLAGLAGGLAAGTRTFGLLLLLPLAYEYVRQYHRPRWSSLWLLLVPAGLGAYLLYSWQSAGDALAFAHAQDSWHRAYAWPLVPQWHAVRLLGSQPLLSAYSLLYVQQLALFALAATTLVLCVAGPWKLRRDQRYLLVYALVLFLPLLVTEVGPQDPLGSIHRFLLEIIPIFMILGRVGRRDLLDRFLLLGMMALNVINMLTFLTKNTFVA
ncbi:mannosyltransferase family protein [Hamadaea tsunoensis]|uniref:mannosyltransferase family protein n=1 Tax=Hamadaea tsunoensis TaxID=53368 RepID=UPI000685A041|nr:mannosyltransferase family protein [Hamadaea tsunoensis]